MKIIVVLFLSVLVISVRSFKAYWNLPSQQCLHNYGLDFTQLLSAYGILVNKEDKFQGNRITIFYDSQLGLYPKILKNGTLENGGIPQAGNLSNHLVRAAEDILSTIPNKNFDGVGVIDWEAWRPSWNFNWSPLDIYREKSKDFAKKNNPSLDGKKIEELAKKEWETGSKSYMLETLLLAQKLRPLAKWGFYLFPDCYNYVGKNPKDFECSKTVKIENDKLFWLWKSSTAIFPSIYLYPSHLDQYSIEQRSWKDNEKLKESMRLASADAEVFPYINHHLEKEVLVPKEDFQRMVAQSAAVGTDGVIIWGASASVGTEKLCNELKDYIINTLGPAIERVAWNSNICSKRVCNGNGICTWPNDISATAWKLFLSNNPNFYAGDIECKCKAKYAGRFCGKMS